MSGPPSQVPTTTTAWVKLPPCRPSPTSLSSRASVQVPTTTTAWVKLRGGGRRPAAGTPAARPGWRARSGVVRAASAGCWPARSRPSRSCAEHTGPPARTTAHHVDGPHRGGQHDVHGRRPRSGRRQTATPAARRTRPGYGGHRARPPACACRHGRRRRRRAGCSRPGSRRRSCPWRPRRPGRGRSPREAAGTPCRAPPPARRTGTPTPRRGRDSRTARVRRCRSRPPVQVKAAAAASAPTTSSFRFPPHHLVGGGGDTRAGQHRRDRGRQGARPGPGQPLRRGRPPAAHAHADSFDVDDQPDHPRRRPGQPDVYEPGSTVPT